MNESKKLTKEEKIAARKAKEAGGQKAIMKEKLGQLGIKIKEDKKVFLVQAKAINYFLAIYQQLGERALISKVNEKKLGADMELIIDRILDHPLEGSKYSPKTWAKTIILAYASSDILGQDHLQAFLKNIKKNEYPRAATTILICLKEIEAVANLGSEKEAAILRRADLYELATYIKILYYQRSLNSAALETIYQGLGKSINYLESSKELLKEGLDKLTQLFVDKLGSDQIKRIIDRILDLEINNPARLVSELYENFKNKEQITIKDIEQFISEHDYLLPIFKKLQTEKQNSPVVSRASFCSSLYTVPVKSEQADDASASVSSFRPQ
ncbi:hypothetical protein [Rickettsiella endosymbiont of Aleochara curtula]|uniref:hypothetical protein n=1 Tax=Rickettsiella endosymbiont of Aleochara curtula TaxID=3077936 RepID=UPI00313E8B4D